MVCYSRRLLPAERGPGRTTPSGPTPESPHIVCSGTIWACGNGGPPPLPVSPPPLPFRRGGEPPHWSTEGEEECARTGDTNPSCNYLVRGYGPSMHFFWRGDRPHFSPPLQFRLARVVRPRVTRRGGPPDNAACALSTSAGQSGAPGPAGPRRSPEPRGRHAVQSMLPF